MPRRPNAKALLKAQERFKAALTEYVISKGARPSKSYDYEVATPAGPLLISVYGNWIACRFEDLELGRLASTTTGQTCNPYSGKWNFHFCDGSVASLEPQAAIALFGSYLDDVLTWQPSENTAKAT
jgi:hypothetical protein